MTAIDGAVLIAGGGIGGLALALALADRGIAARILERRGTFGEAGAGIQIGPNGVHVLRALGVIDQVTAGAGQPDAIVVRSGASARTLARLPLGAAIEARHGAPYLTAHRADLHAALLTRAQKVPAIEIVSGFDVAHIAEGDGRVRVTAVGDAQIDGPMLIGADGLWSTVRKHVAPDAAAAFTGRRAYRAIVPVASAPAALEAHTTTGLWLAPGAHVVHYPVRGGQEIAIVVVVASPALAATGWGLPAVATEVEAHVAKLAPDLRALVSAATDWGAWSLFELAPLATWSRGPVALLGDAAHPMLPFLAQGAVMALEDAVVLAEQLAGCDRVGDAFAAYERARRSRVLRVTATARRNGLIYHLSGPAGFARDLVLQATPGARLLAGYDWLYGWRMG